MKLDIVPYVGVGPLRFGMTPDEAHQHVGRPRLTKHVQGQLREVFSSGGNLVFEGAPHAPRLAQMGFGRTCSDLTYGGVKLFKVPRLDAIRRLLQDDPQAGEVLGFLVFPKLGVAMTGFHDGHEDDLAITVFERGRWDAHLPKMKPFSAP